MNNFIQNYEIILEKTENVLKLYFLNYVTSSGLEKILQKHLKGLKQEYYRKLQH